MSKTRRQLVDQVLDNLGVLVPGQAPSDETIDTVDGRLDPTLSMLAAMEIVYVADTGTPNPPIDGDIDDAIFLPLADMLAQECAAAFNLAGDPALKALADIAEKKLRVIGRPARTRKLLTTDIQLRVGVRRNSGFNFTSGS